jgi:aldehyde oxidoreductase
MQKKAVTINGISKTLIVDPESSLADVLRGQLGLTGTKVGCGTAHCGACSVIVNGKLVRSCVTKMKRIEDGTAITTVEGIGTPDHLHPIQMALVAYGAPQCGFCMPGL